MIHDISPFINLPDVHSRRIDVVDRVSCAVGVGVDGGILLPEGVWHHPAPQCGGICPCSEIEPWQAEVLSLVLLAGEGVPQGR